MNTKTPLETYKPSLNIMKISFKKIFVSENLKKNFWRQFSDAISDE